MEVKRTSLNLPQALFRQAEEALGTRGPKQTIVSALQEAVQLRMRVRLLRRDFSGLTPDVVEELRRPRLPGPVEKHVVRRNGRRKARA